MENRPPFSYQATVGIDWADRKHDVFVRFANGSSYRRKIGSRPEAIQEWLFELRSACAEGKIAIALEQRRGALFYQLCTHLNWIDLYPINPHSLASFRLTFFSSRAKDDPIEYVHGEVGYNYRLTNLLAAVGCAQMEQLAAYVAAKRKIAAHYVDKLQGLAGITTMKNAPWAESTFWMYTIRVDGEKFGMDSRQLMRALGSRQIQCRPLWQPIHQSPAYASKHLLTMPVAEQLAQQHGKGQREDAERRRGIRRVPALSLALL